MSAHELDAATVAANLGRVYKSNAWSAYRSDRGRTVCSCGDGLGSVGIGATWVEALQALAHSRHQKHLAELRAAERKPLLSWIGYGKASW